MPHIADTSTLSGRTMKPHWQHWADGKFTLFRKAHVFESVTKKLVFAGLFWMDTQFLFDVKCADSEEGWITWTLAINNNLLRLFPRNSRRQIFFFFPHEKEISSPRTVSKWTPFRILTWMSFADRLWCKEETCVIFHFVAIVVSISIWITIGFCFGHFRTFFTENFSRIFL